MNGQARGEKLELIHRQRERSWKSIDNYGEKSWKCTERYGRVAKNKQTG
jgi:hypothetical protein